ncbi:hypothetical protein HRbin38_00184 [bacterium HR38]|nr:hypothetical protein HRbin38_00184 [bacterium HR38]
MRPRRSGTTQPLLALRERAALTAASEKPRTSIMVMRSRTRARRSG